MFCKKETSKLYIDFDGVIVDTITPLYEIFKQNGLPINKQTKNREKEKILRELDWTKFINTSKIIKGSIEGIELLIKKGYEITILTHISTFDELEAKLNFLKDNIINSNELNVVGVPKKVSKFLMMDPVGNILVDDYTKNVEEWQNAGGIGIKFSKKQNKKFKTIDNLMDLLDISTQEPNKLKV